MYTGNEYVLIRSPIEISVIGINTCMIIVAGLNRNGFVCNINPLIETTHIAFKYESSVRNTFTLGTLLNMIATIQPRFISLASSDMR